VAYRASQISRVAVSQQPLIGDNTAADAKAKRYVKPDVTTQIYLEAQTLLAEAAIV